MIQQTGKINNHKKKLYQYQPIFNALSIHYMVTHWNIHHVIENFVQYVVHNFKMPLLKNIINIVKF